MARHGTPKRTVATIYNYLRTLKPELIVNNRVGKGRKGMEGLNKGDQEYVGDFGTPEQQIPATGLAGVDWESCMTMNDTWGFKKDDHNWKSTQMLVRNIIDIASKGGNYLLNVGPTAEGRNPRPQRGTPRRDRQVDEGQRRIDLRHPGQPLCQNALGDAARRRPLRAARPGSTCTCLIGPPTPS